jgi:uronate dehydrogenase
MIEKPQKILITGAAGRIGKTLSQAFEGKYPLLRLFDRVKSSATHQSTQIMTGELSDPVALDSAMKDITCVIHLAAIAEERGFEELVEPNIMGAYQLFEAARRAGVSRVIYASSIQAVGFHRLESGVDQGSRIRPSGYYGVTKAFGEALASLYADKFGMSVACLRIASFEPEPQDQRQLATWLSPSDCVKLVKACVDADPFSFEVVYGVSANTRTVVKDAPPAAIDFQPSDDAEVFLPTIGFDPKLKTATSLFSGGGYCGDDFVGDFERVK